MEFDTETRSVTPLVNRSRLDAPPIHTLEPFEAGRSVGRLISDVGAMLSLLAPEQLSQPILDYGAGTGWISEFCVRMGFDVVSLDIQEDLGPCLAARAEADLRVDPSKIRYAVADGHAMPIYDATIGNVLCFDSLHHMHDYDAAFAELHRVLRPGGRSIFVEPGARHSTSPETISFVEAQKKHDPTWIERDVVLEEIDDVARRAGFTNGIRVVPVPLMLPNVIESHSVVDWQRFRSGPSDLRDAHCDSLSEINYWDRVVFFADKT